MGKWIVLVWALSLAGCGNHVPDVPDAHHIVVNGVPMSQLDFLNTYCKKEVAHPTCMRVHRAMVTDVTAGAAPRF